MAEHNHHICGDCGCTVTIEAIIDPHKNLSELHCSECGGNNLYRTVKKAILFARSKERQKLERLEAWLSLKWNHAELVRVGDIRAMLNGGGHG